MEPYNYNSSRIIKPSNTQLTVYITYVYGWMSFGLFLTTLVSWYTAHSVPILSSLLFHNINVMYLILIQLSIVLIFSTFLIHQINSVITTGLFVLYSVITGITLCHIFLYYRYFRLGSIFLIISCIFSAMTFWGYTTKINLLPLRRILYMCLIGFFFLFIMTTLLQSSILLRCGSYLGMVLFVIFTAVDTQKLKEMNTYIDISNSDIFLRYSIIGALMVYLDFLNLFIFLLRILTPKLEF